MPFAAVPAFLVVGVATVAGLAGVARTALRQGVLDEAGYGLDAFERVVGDDAFAAAVWFTLSVTAASTVLAVVGAVAVALAVRRSGRLRGALALPVATPHLVVATLAVVWLAPGGLVDRMAGVLPVSLVGDRHGWGVIVVYAVKEIPFLALLAAATLDDATGELEDTAALLGAGRWARLRDVTLPRVAGPVLAGALVVAAFVVGAVEVPLLVGPTRPDMLGPYALDVVRIDGPSARADAAVVGLVSVAGVALLTAVAAVVHRLVLRRPRQVRP